MDRAHHHAEYVGRNEAQLVCFEADDADQDTIETGQSPAFPTTSPGAACLLTPVYGLLQRVVETVSRARGELHPAPVVRVCG